MSRCLPRLARTYLVLVVLACVALAVRAIVDPPVPPHFAHSLEAAYRYLDAGAVNAAGNALNRARAYRRHDQDLTVIETLVALYGTRDLKRIERETAELAAREPGNASIDLYLGRVYEARGDDVAAERLYRSAIDKDADNAGAWYALAGLQTRLYSLEVAEPSWRRAYRLLRKFEQQVFGYARFLVRAGHVDESLQVLRRLIHRQRDNLVYRVQLLVAGAGRLSPEAVREQVRYLDDALDNPFVTGSDPFRQRWRLETPDGPVVLVEVADKLAFLCAQPWFTGNDACAAGEAR